MFARSRYLNRIIATWNTQVCNIETTYSKTNNNVWMYFINHYNVKGNISQPQMFPCRLYLFNQRMSVSMLPGTHKIPELNFFNFIISSELIKLCEPPKRLMDTCLIPFLCQLVRYGYSKTAEESSALWAKHHKNKSSLVFVDSWEQEWWTQFLV